MIPEATKPKLAEKSREELLAIIDELMAEIERLKQGLTCDGYSVHPSGSLGFYAEI